MTEDNLRKTDGEIVASILALVLALGSGDRSKLRKGEYGSGFWRVWNGAGLDGVAGRRAQRWERFIRAVAIFVSTAEGSAEKFLSSERLGSSMAAAGIKEHSFEKLFLAPADVRVDLLDRLVRRISREATSLNFYDLADLYLYEEPRRMRAISASYYSNLQKIEAD